MQVVILTFMRLYTTIHLHTVHLEENQTSSLKLQQCFCRLHERMSILYFLEGGQSGLTLPCCIN